MTMEKDSVSQEPQVAILTIGTQHTVAAVQVPSFPLEAGESYHKLEDTGTGSPPTMACQELTKGKMNLASHHTKSCPSPLHP